MADDWCCDSMGYHATHECEVHDRDDCPDVVMNRYVNSDGSTWYGIPISDGGSSAVEVLFCPWCGTSLARTPGRSGTAAGEQTTTH